MIRLLEPGDAKQYYELRLEALKENPEAFAQSYEEIIQNKLVVEQYEEKFRLGASYNFGAFKDGKLVGMVTLSPESKTKLKHKANIFAMYVTPNERGKGIAEALLEKAIQQARNMGGIKKINLTVVSINLGAKALYKKYGFKTFGIEEKALLIKNVYYDEEYMSLFLK
ncbi:GNAT family N-acetyltransferase [Ornithinibacillus scapharcae]|uniref:GNAT family N-acetyltransferase n=1 Tax=Ornithinibacillus scapharcae TaxID=1147159 RepID=UPI000225B026|nr:GNAT family N-acetyltransferase [Ornithinibacillus scapharcae]